MDTIMIVIGLHGDKPQYVREKNLAQFNSGYKPILIATDVASRGLDFKDVKWVVNFEFPQTIEDYVHRIGRTGRAGREGSAYSFITEDEKRLAKPLVDLLRAAGQPVDQSLIDMAARATIAMHAKNAAKYSKYRANRYGSSSSSSYSSYSNNNGNRSTNHWQGRPSGSGYSNASSSSTSFSSQSTSSSGSYNNNWNYSSSSHR
jgi:superfamily II DNA/RNA helicase